VITITLTTQTSQVPKCHIRSHLYPIPSRIAGIYTPFSPLNPLSLLVISALRSVLKVYRPLAMKNVFSFPNDLFVLSSNVLNLLSQ
jgi:hypothetical protein